MIGNMNFKSRVFLAPMAGITDKPMRKLIASLGSGNIVSEMVAVNAIQRRNPKSYKIADVRDEPYPVIVQLVGNDPQLFADAAKLIAELGAASIDINMGCPVKKIVNNNSGSALLKDLPLAGKIIESVVKSTPLKVSVKFRKGWDNNHINAVDTARMCEQSGASYITVHGRTRSDFYAGTADWDIIAEVKNAVKLPVIGNGDVTSPQKAREMIDYTGVDGIMIGRATLGAPWLVNACHHYLEEGELLPEPTVSQTKEILLTHIKELIAYYGEKLALPLSRKYVCWYSKNLRDARRFRESYVKIENFADAFSAIDDYFNNCSKI